MIILGAASLFLMLGLGILAQTENTSPEEPSKPAEVAAPVQPIPFSHKNHLAFGLKCELCHANPDPGINMTFPSTAQCMVCHVTVVKDRADIQKLAQYDKSKKQVPWVRVYSVPSSVNWNHRTHLQAGMKCELCHGQVAEMDTMKVATKVTTMQGCIDCHQLHDAPVGCRTCHEDTDTP